jgi:hypothetical protein
MLPSVKTNTSAPESIQVFAAQWLACVLPCRRFDVTLTSADARLGAGAGRYPFTVVDLHLLLLAGFAGAPKFLNFARYCLALLREAARTIYVACR